MSSEASLTTIAICQLLTTIAWIVVVAAIVYAVFAFKKLVQTKIDEAMGRVQPVVDQAKAVAEQAKETAENVSSKIDSIMTAADRTAEHVGATVRNVSTSVESAVSPQVATAAGLVTAAVKCVEIYRDVNKSRRPKVERSEEVPPEE